MLVAARAHRHHQVRDQQRQPIRLVKSISVLFPKNAVGHPSRANRIASFSLVLNAAAGPWGAWEIWIFNHTLQGEFVLCLFIGTLANCCFLTGIQASDLDRLLLPPCSTSGTEPRAARTVHDILGLTRTASATPRNPVISSHVHKTRSRTADAIKRDVGLLRQLVD
jgi:hypothetical protein